MDEVIQSTIKECADDEDRWDENYITIELLKALKNHFRNNGNRLYTVNRSILLNAYKNKGKIENKYGDIIFIIRRFVNNVYMDGLGFCEAKKEYKSGKLNSLKTDQLIKMNQEVSNHKLLLYLRKYNTSFEKKLIRMGLSRIVPWPIYLFSTRNLVCTIPSINAVKIGSKKAHDYLQDSIPLSYQIMGKYLEGFDLIYDEKLFREISRGERYGSYLVSIVYGYPDQTIDAEIPVNDEVWEEISDE